MKHAKKAFLASLLSTLLCVTMLIGTTFAWFTDSVTSGGNIIKSGTLDVEMKWANGTEDPATAITNTTVWKDASTGAIFNYELWEPGYVEVRHLDIANVGTLALKYQLRIVANGTMETNANGHTLADAIDVYYVDPATRVTDRAALVPAAKIGTLAEVLDNINNGGASSTAQGILYPAGTSGHDSEHKVTIALKMREDAGNEYQNMSLGTNFSVQLLATQYTYESDSFNDQYDLLADGTPDNANFPTQTASATVTANTPTVVDTGIAKATVPAGSDNADAGDSLTLTVEPGDANPNLTVDALSGSTTYEVTLQNQDGDKVTNTNDGIKIELNIGVVDLQNFYHNGTALTAVGSLDQLALNKYYYDQNAGIVTFITDSFSPFTAIYKFEGGIGTQKYPYLLATTEELYNIDVNIASLYPEGGTDKVYYKLLNDLDVAAEDGSSWAHSFLTEDTRTFAIDLNGKTISLGAKYLFGYAVNLEIYNGTIAYSGVGTSVVGYGCYQDVNSYSMNFHDLTLTGSIVGNTGSHYGPLVSYGFLIDSGSGVFVADKIVNNLTITSANSDGYVGGLFGYIQGSCASATITNCTFNGSISAPHVGAFINTCSAPKVGVSSTGNTLNGTLFGTKDARAFGCNGNVTGGADTLNALNNSVTLGSNAVITGLAASTDLISIDAENKISFRKVDGVASYRAAVVFSVGQGYPRFITKDFAENGADSYETGLFKYGVKNESADGSTSATVIENRDGEVIWLADGDYHYYSTYYDVSSVNATIYVYAYDANGTTVAWQAISYPLN